MTPNTPAKSSSPALRSGCAYWPQVNPPADERPPLVEDASCDVAIIGGGITGALTAFLLTDHGVETVLVDRGRTAAGSTAASTALLQYEVDLHLCELRERIGPDAAIRAYQLGREAIDVIRDLLRRIDDRCGFEEQRTLYLASRDADVAALQAEFFVRQQAGFDVDFLTEADMRGRWSVAAPAALLSHGNGQVDSVRLTRRLLDWAIQHGARVYEGTDVTGWEARTHGGIRLMTAAGRRIDARRIVFATGYESERYLGRSLGNLNSTFAVVSEPLTTFEGWADRCQVWESARPYFYLRATPDGRAMIGGEDDPHAFAHGDVELLTAKSRKLIRRFRTMFPAIDFRVDSAWAGTFGESRDGLPMIGSTAAIPDACFALGFGGNGMTHSVIAAQIIADLHQGRRNRDSELFRLDR